MDMVWTFIVGLIVGGAAKFIMPGKDPGGLFVTGLIGTSGPTSPGGWGHKLDGTLLARVPG